MTNKQLEELGFYQEGNHIKQIHGYGEVDMDLGWFGLKVDIKHLTPAMLIRIIYEAGQKNGRKIGANNIRQQIADILTIEE
jgi:hypothetical protein